MLFYLKTKNKTNLKLLLIISILITSLTFTSSAQNYTYALFPGDTALLVFDKSYDSTIWQKSKDSISWTDIAGATDSTLQVITDTSYTKKYYFRVKNIDTTECRLSAFYSTTIVHRVLDSLHQVQVGDWFHGGVVFYTYSTGHGLIAPTSDQSSSCEWGCYGTAIGSSAQSLSDGKSNTAAIVNYHDSIGYYNNPTQCNQYNDGTVAAKLCDTISINGYEDWYLPAKNELNYLYQKKTLVGGFSRYGYWSSSEYNAYYAWRQYFGNGGQYYTYKYYYNRVRCIRSY
ncbi:MAG: DUF1566 domain-containing protein [Bacteroidota bacterium]|nr:DUF1566 domain-containing protein [Bacteroidota bacterium]